MNVQYYSYPPKHFRPHEIEGLAPLLVLMLDVARERSGVPYIINSGFRTPEKNAAVGGEHDSSHLKGLAVDIRCLNDKDRHAMVYGLLSAGFVRIILYPSHIHVDIDGGKTRPMLGLRSK